MRAVPAPLIVDLVRPMLTPVAALRTIRLLPIKFRAKWQEVGNVHDGSGSSGLGHGHCKNTFRRRRPALRYAGIPERFLGTLLV